MAKAILTKKSLVLKFQKGVDDNSKPKFATQKFSKISLAADDAKLYEVGVALAGLLASETNFVLKEDDYHFEAAPSVI